LCNVWTFVLFKNINLNILNYMLYFKFLLINQIITKSMFFLRIFWFFLKIFWIRWIVKCCAKCQRCQQLKFGWSNILLHPNLNYWHSWLFYHAWPFTLFKIVILIYKIISHILNLFSDKLTHNKIYDIF
jgi:hypothetical protein